MTRQDFSEIRQTVLAYINASLGPDSSRYGTKIRRDLLRGIFRILRHTTLARIREYTRELEFVNAGFRDV